MISFTVTRRFAVRDIELLRRPLYFDGLPLNARSAILGEPAWGCQITGLRASELISSRKAVHILSLGFAESGVTQRARRHVWTSHFTEFLLPSSEGTITGCPTVTVTFQAVTGFTGFTGFAGFRHAQIPSDPERRTMAVGSVAGRLCGVDFIGHASAATGHGEISLG